MSEIELKPCPFCGGSVTLEQPMGERSKEWWGVVCRNTENLGGTCAIEQRPSRTKEAAADRWNRRSDFDARIRSAIERKAEPVAWTNKRNINGAKNRPREAWTIWGEKSGTINIPLYPCLVTFADLIAKIAQVANAVGWQANEPSMEIAGQIVSVLAANPEHIDRFMSEGTELFLDGTFNAENGCLTYRSIRGDILNPSVLREQKGTQQ